MGRKKIDIKKIGDEKTLLVTFAKRKVGLFNKAYELSQLCDCKVAILIFTNKNKIHKYTSHDIDEIIKRYQDDRDGGVLVTNSQIIEVSDVLWEKTLFKDALSSMCTADRVTMASLIYTPVFDLYLSWTLSMGGDNIAIYY